MIFPKRKKFPLVKVIIGLLVILVMAAGVIVAVGGPPAILKSFASGSRNAVDFNLDTNDSEDAVVLPGGKSRMSPSSSNTSYNRATTPTTRPFSAPKYANFRKYVQGLGYSFDDISLSKLMDLWLQYNGLKK